LSNLVISGLDDCGFHILHPEYRTFGISTVSYEYVEISIWMQVYYGPGDIRWTWWPIARGRVQYVLHPIAGTITLTYLGDCPHFSGTVYWDGTCHGPFGEPFPIQSAEVITCIP
jgi:hypothetical protein